MSKFEVSTTILPSLYPRTERDSIPIRSIVYKKSSTDSNDTTMKKVTRHSLSEVPYSIVAGQSSLKPLKIPSGAPQTAQTYRDVSQPHVIHQIHKVSLGKKSQAHTARNSPMPLKTLAKSAMKSQLHSRRDSNPDIMDQTNYFNILRDENRKTFKVEDFQGVDDYSSEVVMSRIYKQGFRDPGYYSKAVNFGRMEAPDEQTIKEKYNFRIGAWIAPMENERTQAAHVLGGATNNVAYIESVLEAAREANEELIKQKAELKEEIDELNRKFTQEMENVVKDYSKKFEDIDEYMKNDNIKKQAEGFKVQKEITMLKRDKILTEKKIVEAIKILDSFENSLYGRKIFDLETVHEGLENISATNLRNDKTGLMQNSHIIH